MGLVAEALRDPRLHERSIRIYSPEPNELQSLDIAKHYLECGDAEGALRWLQGPWRDSSEYERLRLLDRAYAKAYGHGARYLRALQELGSRIDDYHGHPTHEVYEKTLRLAHGRKTRFWARFLES